MSTWPLVILFGDYGTPVQLRPSKGNGTPILHDELSASTFQTVLYRRESLKNDLSILSNDTTIKVDRKTIDSYESGDKVLIENEECTVASINYEESEVKLTRITPRPHKKGSIITHVTAESATATEYDVPTRRLLFKPEIAMSTRIGSFRMEIEIDTGTERITATGEGNQQYALRVRRDGNNS